MVDGDGTGLKHIFGGLCQEKDDKHGAHLLIHTPKGVRKVYYKGGSKNNSVGGITGLSLGSVAFMEINLLNMNMIQECFRRTFAAKNRFHMADLNPPSPMHPVIKEVFDVQDTKWRHWTIHDNPILTEERKKDIYNVLIKSPYLFARDWEGKRVMPDGVVYSMFSMSENIWDEVKGQRYEMFFVADGGTSDATSCSCNIVVRHEDKFKLLRVANYYHSGADTGQVKAMSVYARELKKFAKWCTDKFQMKYTEFMVDPACKSLREELHLVGIDTRGAMNNAHDKLGSVVGLEVGIERAQNAIQEREFMIVETDEYGHYDFLREIGLYVRQDNGKPIDKWNHSLDDFRYTINYFYKHYK